MTAPMTLEGAIEEARRQGLRWVAQEGGQDWVPCWTWHGFHNRPELDYYGVGWNDFGMATILGTGSPNPDGWRETLTEVR